MAEAIPMSPYGVSIEEIDKIVDPKNPAYLEELGGPQGLLSKLHAKSEGLSNEEHPNDPGAPFQATGDFKQRKQWFGTNYIPPPPPRTLLQIILATFNDRMLQILLIVATISTFIGILQDTGVLGKEDATIAPWAEGVAIFIAVLVVVLVGSLNDYQKEKQYRQLSAQKENKSMTVLRNGTKTIIRSAECVVGDICVVEPGDLILVDGIFLSGYNLFCDESSATGESDLIDKTKDPIMISGSKVSQGIGQFLVIAVGKHAFYGKTMMALQQEDKPTPLEEKLFKLTEIIAKLGIAAGILLFIALTAKLLITEALTTQFEDPQEVGLRFLTIFIETITIIVVAVPEGLPLAVTLALVYAGKRMIKDNNFVRIISACEVMGHATTICSDKTGTLTQNQMTVVDSYILDEETAKYCIANNKTASMKMVDGKEEFIGNKTEIALLQWVKNYSEYEQEIAQLFPFSSEMKSMTCVVKTSTGYRYYIKGASEIILSYCKDPMDGYAEIDRMAQNALRTIGCCYKDVDVIDGQIVTECTLVGIFGIEDPLREGVAEAVKKCHKAGVIVRMVTGDNVKTARAIASKCHILKGGIVMEGPQFRQLKEKELDRVCPKLQVLARSSPLDKKILVDHLQKMGHVVAVTGDGTNDSAALKKADVGFSMGKCGTEVAKEASSIILMDDNFTSIVKALMWGRTVNDAVKKFLQFQLTVNFSAVLVTFITGVAGASPALKAIQLLWLNLIMDSFGALALATENPSEECLERLPESKNKSLITFYMWKLILSQGTYQIVLSCIIAFAGPVLFYNKTVLAEAEQLQLNGLVFNTFVFAQLFNQINCRRLDNGINVFYNLHRNYYFIVVTLITVAGQLIIMFVGGGVFGIAAISGTQWILSVVLGMVTLLIGVMVRFIPDELFGYKPQQDVVVMNAERLRWQSAIDTVRTELRVFKALRGVDRLSMDTSKDIDIE